MHKVHGERWGCVMNSSGGYEADKVSVSCNYVGKCWQKRRVSVGKGNTPVSVVLSFRLARKFNILHNLVSAFQGDGSIFS